MRFFQCIHTYKGYDQYLEQKYQLASKGYSFQQMVDILIQDGFSTVHMLQPVFDGSGFYTLWNYLPLQLQWAKEHGLAETDPKKILFAQLAAFKPDVFYNLSPIQFTADEIRQALPASTIKFCWYASPETDQIDFSVYHARFTNLPSDVDEAGTNGFYSFYFPLADSPVFHPYQATDQRTIDVLFFGQYLDLYFDKRNQYIDELIRIKNKHNLRMELALLTYYRSKPFIRRPLPLGINRLIQVPAFPPKHIRQNMVEPLFGKDMLDRIGQAKIVFNCHVDIAGNYRVNMRLYETLGCGAHLLGDSGIYPAGLIPGQHFTTYDRVDELESKILHLLAHSEQRIAIAQAGQTAVRTQYSKQAQWDYFCQLVSRVQGTNE